MTRALGFDNARRWRVESHPSNTWFTPPELLEPIRALLGGIVLDPCTTVDNPTGAERFYTADDDGILQLWDASTIFANPPYGPTLPHWVEKCRHAGAAGSRVVLLVSTRPEARYYQAALEGATSILMLRGRTAFVGLDRHTAMPCTLFGFGVSLRPIAHLGVALRRDDS